MPSKANKCLLSKYFRTEEFDRSLTLTCFFTKTLKPLLDEQCYELSNAMVVLKATGECIQVASLNDFLE